MPALTIYLKEEIYEELKNIPSGERSKLINSLLKRYFSRKKKSKKEER